MFDYSSFPIIETERLLLRRMTDDDAPAILAEFGDPRVLEHLDPDPPVTDIESALSFLHWLDGMFTAKTALRWAITLHDSGTMIGTCGFHRWDLKNRRAEIGYDLQTAYWRQGYAAEATRAMMRFCFSELNLHRLEADCNEGNIGSAAVLEKCGFTYEGLWRHKFFEHDMWINLKQYSILETEYAALQESE